MKLLDRALGSFGLQRISAANDTFQGASFTRLNGNWIGTILSADQEIRYSLRQLRARSRELVRNNGYAARFVSLVKQNVVGPNGHTLEAAIAAMADTDTARALAKKQNDELERGWRLWGRSVTTDGRMTMVDALGLALANLVTDGEVFIRKQKGYPHNRFGYAIEFLDPDTLEETFWRNASVDADGKRVNEIRMSVEIDEWRRPVAYWVRKNHPSEFAAVERIRIPADEIIHAYVFRRPNQTRGVPFMAAAMTRIQMLGGYEEAELVAARVAACKMGFITSKTGDDYKGEPPKKGKSGATEINVAPASIDKLPEGHTITPLDWQHPNAAFGEFTKAMLRGVASGVDVSYSSLTGDLRDVNFSSLRSGVLAERDGWRYLQTFAIQHITEPIFDDFVPTAIVWGALQLPAPPANYPEFYCDSVEWHARGWDWVDPGKDIDADVTARRACMSTLAEIASKRGKDWRSIVDQIAVENEYAKSKGVVIDLTTRGGGGVEGAPQGEETVGGETGKGK